MRAVSTACTVRVGGALGETLQAVGLSAPSDGVPPTAGELELLTALDLDHLRIDVHLDDAKTWEESLRSALAVRERLGWALELALFLRPEHEPELALLQTMLEGVPIARTLVVFAGGQTATPFETTPAELVELVRRHIGQGPVAGGTDMNFCEFNRTRPEARAMDAVFYSITPQVHAFDDISVVETLEAQADTVRTARAIAPGKPVIVSPITLKRRFNPVATAEEVGPSEGQLPDSVDHRQLSLFGAAWTTGSVKRLMEAGAAALTYFETTGWHGVLERESGSQSGELFPSLPGEVFPLYHVFRDLGELKGKELLVCSSDDPLTTVGLAVRDYTETSLLIANLSPEPRRVRIEGLAGPATARRLNDRTAARACASPNEFRAKLERIDDVTAFDLDPFETARINAKK